MRRVRRPLLALIALIAALGIGYGVRAADSGNHAPARTATVRVSSLPVQARHTLALIARNGPFPYPEDGETFHNYERELPAEPDGYYREYTVPTPGSPDRGARRLIVGQNGQTFYTDDHYGSFERVTGAG